MSILRAVAVSLADFTSASTSSYVSPFSYHNTFQTKRVRTRAIGMFLDEDLDGFRFSYSLLRRRYYLKGSDGI